MAKITPPGRKAATRVLKNPIVPTYLIGYSYKDGPTTYLVPRMSSVPARARHTVKRIAYDQNTNRVVAYLRLFR